MNADIQFIKVALERGEITEEYAEELIAELEKADEEA